MSTLTTLNAINITEEDVELYDFRGNSTAHFEQVEVLVGSSSVRIGVNSEMLLEGASASYKDYVTLVDTELVDIEGAESSATTASLKKTPSNIKEAIELCIGEEVIDWSFQGRDAISTGNFERILDEQKEFFPELWEAVAHDQYGDMKHICLLLENGVSINIWLVGYGALVD